MDEDHSLAKQMRAGDPDAYRAFVLRFQNQIFRLCMRTIGNEQEAEDLTQEVLIRAIKAIEHFRGDSSLSTWLYRIAVNLCRNRIEYLKRRRQSHQVSYEERLHSVKAIPTSHALIPGPADQVESREAIALVEQALHSLPADLRSLLILRDLEHLEYADISRIMELPLGTVKSRLHRARALLIKTFESQGGER